MLGEAELLQEAGLWHGGFMRAERQYQAKSKCRNPPNSLRSSNGPKPGCFHSLNEADIVMKQPISLAKYGVTF